MALFNGGEIAEAASALTENFKSIPASDGLQSYLQESAEALQRGWGHPHLTWPVELEKIVSPLWLGKVLPPSGLMLKRWSAPISPVGTFEESERIRIKDWVLSHNSYYNCESLPTELVPSTLPSLLLTGFDIVRVRT